jgi:O-antigen ligase
MAGVDYEKVNLNVRTPHNAHLQTIFDTGFVGTALLLLALLWPVWHALKAGRGATAFCLLLPLCVMIGSTSFSFVIWREWIPGATILMVFFLLLSRDKTA